MDKSKWQVTGTIEWCIRRRAHLIEGDPDCTRDVGIDGQGLNVRVHQSLGFCLMVCVLIFGMADARAERIHVRAGGDLQAALDFARPGDTVVLEAGATFTGPFTLPRKSGDQWITVRSSAPDPPAAGTELPLPAHDPKLPAAGMRVNPSHAPLMPKLEADFRAVIVSEPGAHHFRFVGVEISPSPGTFLFNVVLLGTGEESSEAELPHNIVFERCYIHGDPLVGSRRGIALNGRDLRVLDSYLSDFKEVGSGAQAMAGWNGPGPFKIVNNYLEGASVNLLFGGGDPAIPDLVPSDIEIRGNHFHKPLRWRIDDPDFAGIPWTVKNLFELKNARRVLVEGNLFEHSWAHSQDGFAILFTVRNQDGGAEWSVVEDVTFINNIVRHAASGINILGHDNNFPSEQTKRILIKNNLFEDVDGERWGGSGRLFQLLDQTADIIIDHNTALQSGNIITSNGAPHPGFIYRNNITPHNDFGVVGADKAPGNDSLETFFPGHIFKRNVLIGGNPLRYPDDNFFPESPDGVGFVDFSKGDFRLGEDSPFRGAGTDGEDIGVDFDELISATAGTVAGIRSELLRAPTRPVHRRRSLTRMFHQGGHRLGGKFLNGHD